MNTLQNSYAAVDLGSNSFHMIVAKEENGQIKIVDRIKTMVRLAGGLDEDNRLSDEVMQDAFACLERFEQRLKSIPRAHVRIVGTNTLRQAKNGQSFLMQANLILGHRIEIISGREEGRLIYVGVANTIFDNDHKRLIVDIGGGSTEFVIGKGFETYLTESLYMGCVNISKRFFKDGDIDEKRFRKAIIASKQELETIQANYLDFGWELSIGASGTINNISKILQAEGWIDTRITLKGLYKLKNYLIDLGHMDKIKFEVLAERRKPVLASGLAILIAIFESLEISEMMLSSAALREGLLYDIIGRKDEKDIRDKTVDELLDRYAVDRKQAFRVSTTALDFFRLALQDWNIDEQRYLKPFLWASYLHEIGLAIAHSQYHKHGAYLIENSDLAGFSRQEQRDIAFIIRSHRRKFPIIELEEIAKDSRKDLLRLSILLRLAVVLNRARSQTSLPLINIEVNENRIKLEFPKEWLDQHPLHHEDLITEKNYLVKVDIDLQFT